MDCAKGLSNEHNQVCKVLLQLLYCFLL